MTEIARLVSVAAGAWLIAIGLLMVISPGRCLTALAAAGSSRVIHLGELIPRVIVGSALVLVAPVSAYPIALALIGWLLVITGAALIVLPMRWHSAYSGWWAQRIPETAVRLLGPVSVVAGGALIWSVV